MSHYNGTDTKLSVDRPGDSERPAVRQLVVVEGWAWAPEGAPAVAVTAGDRSAEVMPGPWRPDVSSALGIGDVRGYVATASIAGLPPGPIEIVATATGADGIAVEVRRTADVTTVTDAGTARPRPLAAFSERLDPRTAPGGLTHVEHVARYRWAAQLADGPQGSRRGVRRRLWRADPARRGRGAGHGRRRVRGRDRRGARAGV